MTDYTRVADKLPPEGVVVEIMRWGVSIGVYLRSEHWFEAGTGESLGRVPPDDEWRPCNVEKD